MIILCCNFVYVYYFFILNEFVVGVVLFKNCDIVVSVDNFNFDIRNFNLFLRCEVF